MAQVTFRFLEPTSFIGRLVTWRLNEPWSHVVILIDDTVYSSQVPFVAMLPTDHASVAIPPRTGLDVVLDVTDEEAQSIKDWCESQVGILYDIASILGWLFGFKWLQSKTRSYCFEFCRKPLVQLGWLSPSKDLIRGERLIDELHSIIKSRTGISILQTGRGWS